MTTQDAPPQLVDRTRRLAANFATAFGVLALLAGAAATAARSTPAYLVPLAPDTWAMLTSFTDFGIVAYAVAAVMLGCALLLRASRHRVVLVVLVVLLAGLHLSWILPRYVPDSDPPAAPAPTIRVLTLNLEFGQGNPTEVVAAAQDADVLVLVEITEPARHALEAAGIGRRFGHALNRPLPVAGSNGTTVFSRYPITGSSVFGGTGSGAVGAGDRQNWLVTMQIPGFGAMQLAAVHPRRPHLGQDRWTPDQDELHQAALWTEPDLVAGDFNAVESHSTMRALRADGYRTSADSAGAGWQPTWPANQTWLPPLIGIDHILLRPSLTATASDTISVQGTDHLGVLATITRSD